MAGSGRSSKGNGFGRIEPPETASHRRYVNVAGGNETPVTAKHIPEHMAAVPRPLNAGAEAGHRFAFLLVPGFTYIGFASAIEPLRMANMAADAETFGALTVTIDGEPVRASNGVLTTPDHSIENLPDVDSVIVCGPNPIRYPDTKRLIGWLRSLARRGIELGGIDTGSDLLARAGLLNGYHCTIHWQDMAVMLARYPRIIVSNHLFEIDRDRFTSGGGTAAMDMMLELIRRHENGAEIAAAVADLIVHDRMRDSHDRQRIPLRQRLGTTRPKLTSTVAIMEANLEDPLRMSELAEYVQLSERQLERLFRDHLGCTPTQYYMELRLNMARQQILNTDEAITEVARGCGFSSPSHFTRRYAELFGVTPSEERRRSARAESQQVQGSRQPGTA